MKKVLGRAEDLIDKLMFCGMLTTLQTSGSIVVAN